MGIASTRHQQRRLDDHVRIVGASKRLLLEEMERDYFEDVKRWLTDKLTNGGTIPLWREVRDGEVYAAEDEYEAQLWVG
jgi:hypothetical protein